MLSLSFVYIINILIISLSVNFVDTSPVGRGMGTPFDVAPYNSISHLQNLYAHLSLSQLR